MALIEETIDKVHPTTPKTQMAQLLYFLHGVIVSSNCLLYRRGGKMKAITPAPRAPAMSRKVVKSGITSAIPVMNMIIMLRITTFFSFKWLPSVK